jgi:short-chain Z-isoprenyl diphosphate synthase
MPKHVGVVLDGNRRFARKSGLLSIAEGHRVGADRAEDLINWCDDLGIPVVTVWALSTDNFKRDPEELESIFTLVEEKIDELGRAHAQPSPVRVGRLELRRVTRASIAINRGRQQPLSDRGGWLRRTRGDYRRGQADDRGTPA